MIGSVNSEQEDRKMAKKQSETGATAKVTDYRREVDGTTNPQYGKEIEIKYNYDFEELETTEAGARNFAPADLIKLANSRLKSTANSGARQIATKPYQLVGDDLA